MLKIISTKNSFRILNSLVCGTIISLAFFIRISFFWNLSLRYQIPTFILLSFIFGTICFTFLKLTEVSQIVSLKPRFIGVVLIIILISILFHLPTYENPSWMHILTIQYNGESQGKGVELTGLIAPGNNSIPLENFIVNSGWIKNNGNLSNYGDVKAKVEYKFKSKSDQDVEIHFLTGPDAGKVTINLDEKEKSVDLQTPEKGDIIFKIQTGMSIPKIIMYSMRAIDIFALSIVILLILDFISFTMGLIPWEKLKIYIQIIEDIIIGSVNKLNSTKKNINFLDSSIKVPIWLFPFSLFVILATGVAFFYYDIFRASLFIFIIYTVLGSGPALLFMKRDPTLWHFFAVSPVLGFCLISVFGSWLISLNLTISSWAFILLYIISFFNIVVCVIFAWRNQSIFRKTELEDLFTISLIYLVSFLIIILAVAIGGLKLSVLRGNPDDANNYMAMALILKNIPLILATYGKTSWLFNQNPLYPWTSLLLTNRWTTSAVLSWGSIITGIPIYRLDFAYGALCFVIMAGPTYFLARLLRLSYFHSFLTTLAVGLGFYAQLVLDIRALSETTALPVLLFLILSVIIYSNDRDLIEHNIIIVFATLALFFLYPEIFTILGPGLLLFSGYCIFHHRVDFFKILKLGVLFFIGIGIALATQPSLISFFTGQLSFASSNTVNWQTAFFQWLFENGLAGPLGLSPYYLNLPFMQSLLSFVGLILIVIFGIIIFNIFRENKPSFISIILASSCIAGFILFYYFYLTGRLWQAGKAFTYFYPMVILTFTQGIIIFKQQSRSNKSSAIVLSKLAGFFILLWLLSQTWLGFYRIINVVWGFEYPGSIVNGRNDSNSYQTKYEWDIKPFQEIFKDQKPIVWLSTSYKYEEFFEIELDQYAQLVSSSLKSGYTSVQDTANPPDKAPDYLLASSDKLPFIDKRLYDNLVFESHGFELFRFNPQLLNSPLVVNINSFNDGSVQEDTKNAKSGFIIDGGSIEYYSPEKGIVEITLNIFPNDKKYFSSNPIHIQGIPAGRLEILQNFQNPIKIRNNSQSGLNIIKFSGPPFVLQIVDIK